MPKVTFIIDGEPTTVEFESGKLPYSHHGKPESFLDVAKNLGVPLEHACGGSCACTTCHVFIREGAQHLSEMQDDEADRQRIDAGEFLGERDADLFRIGPLHRTTSCELNHTNHKGHKERFVSLVGFVVYVLWFASRSDLPS